MVASGAAGTAGPPPGPPAGHLPDLALERPAEALAAARELIAAGADPVSLSYAHQAAGIVLRDDGRPAEALVELRAGLRAARRAGDPGRATDVRATLGATLVRAGRTGPGLRELDAAVADAGGALLARVLVRRGFARASVGRHDEALADMRLALSGVRRAGDGLWEARTLNNRATLHMLRGSLRLAEADLDRAEALFVAHGSQLEAVDTRHNRGVVARGRGDLPRALALFDETARRYEELDFDWADPVVDRCHALLAAGLSAEAVAVVGGVLARRLGPTVRAELLLVASAALLADGATDQALARAREALGAFRGQDRDWWVGRAELAVLRARVARGDRGPALARDAAELALRLARQRSEEAPVALLVAGQLAAPGSPAAHDLLGRAARHRRAVTPLVRATGWLALAVDRGSGAGRRGVLSACGRGLDALDEHRMTLGSSELRALATGHGEQLARLAVREAVAGGDARRLLAWTERWRGTALTQPPVRPAPAAGTRARAERDVRSERHRLPGVAGPRARFDVRRLADEVGDDTFVELLESDGLLHAITVSRGRVRRHPVGPVAEATAAVAAARFVLRQAARGRPASLDGVGERLERALLGPGVAALVTGTVTISPPSRLHAAPWALLPSLAGRPVASAPSALTWQRARAVRADPGGPLVLVAGPGLGTGGAEVDALARAEPSATVLRGGSATVAATLAALDGARLAHVAAHGEFRPDSPMFSSLLLDDGPLTVHDFELLERAPHRLVLSACDSGVMVPVGADELLGLAAALLSLGSAGVVSAIAEVNDEATVAVMVDLHEALGRGLGLAEVLMHARERARGDLVREATAAAFTAVGA